MNKTVMQTSEKMCMLLFDRLGVVAVAVGAMSLTDDGSMRQMTIYTRLSVYYLVAENAWVEI